MTPVVRVMKEKRSQVMMAPGLMREAGAAFEALEWAELTGFFSRVRGFADLGVLAINNPIPE
jgi:hypothetical protein